MKSRLTSSSAQPFFGVVMLLLVLSCNGHSPTEPLAQQQPQPKPPAATGFVSGTVLVSSGACLPGAVVEVLDGARAGDRLTQNECGGAWDYGPPGYSFSVPAGIAVRIRASKQGYRSSEETFLPTNFVAGQYYITLKEE